MKNTNLLNLVKENITINGDLQNTYFDILEAEICNFDNLEEIKNYMENDCICSIGAVSGLIYYSETEEVFKNHFNEILELVEDMKSEYGNDLLQNMELTANNLVWLTFEETVRSWFYEIEDLQEDEEEDEE